LSKEPVPHPTLRAALLVETRREGTFIHYRLADAAVHDLRSGHVPGALSVPLRDLRDQLERFGHPVEAGA
jgi:DNA-binding transcriptional ArsR family regulator